MAGTIDNIKAYLETVPEVRLAYLFGSTAQGRAGAESDMDIAIQTEAPLPVAKKMALMAALADLSGRPIDLVDVNRAGEPLLGEILRHGVRLKGADSLHATLIQRHIYNTEDFLPAVRRLLAERRQQWIP